MAGQVRAGNFSKPFPISENKTVEISFNGNEWKAMLNRSIPLKFVGKQTSEILNSYEFQFQSTDELAEKITVEFNEEKNQVKLKKIKTGEVKPKDEVKDASKVIYELVVDRGIFNNSDNLDKAYNLVLTTSSSQNCPENLSFVKQQMTVLETLESEFASTMGQSKTGLIQSSYQTLAVDALTDEKQVSSLLAAVRASILQRSQSLGNVRLKVTTFNAKVGLVETSLQNSVKTAITSITGGWFGHADYNKFCQLISPIIVMVKQFQDLKTKFSISYSEFINIEKEAAKVQKFEETLLTQLSQKQRTLIDTHARARMGALEQESNQRLNALYNQQAVNRQETINDLERMQQEAKAKEVIFKNFQEKT